MRLPRFFISPEQVVGSRITITGEDVRHIAVVLRMKAADELHVCDGNGTEYRVKITDMHRSEIRTEIVSRAMHAIREPRVTLCQGLPKSDKMDLIVQKATELGVASIVPLITERTVLKVRDGEKRVNRWRKIAREAAMQSSRTDIPVIEPIRSFREFLFSPNPGPRPPVPAVTGSELRTLRLMPWEEGTEPIKRILRGKSDAAGISVLIGPEGGFSPAEATMARERGFHLVSLGPNILRTETAAIAALAMIGYEFGKADARG